MQFKQIHPNLTYIMKGYKIWHIFVQITFETRKRNTWGHSPFSLSGITNLKESVTSSGTWYTMTKVQVQKRKSHNTGGSKGRTFWKGTFPILCSLEWFEGPKFLLKIVCKASGTHHNFFCFQNFSSQHSGCNVRLITITSETRQEKHSKKGWVNLADIYHKIKSITFLPHEVGLPHRWSKWP